MKRIYMAIISILCSIGIAIAISHAWFVSGYDVDPLATGSSAEAYYHSGTGTQSDPFVITTPRHLYNLAWLQYLGRYNADVKDNNSHFPATYFKLGTSAGGSLDMTGWPLPPIGTAKFPFIGNFNGNGWTISDLTTTNNFSEFGNKHPSGINGSNFEQENCGTIGFFGAIGAYNDSVISNTDTTTGCTYDEANNTAFNFYLNNTNVHTNISTTIIGAVAGYVNAELAQVGVIQPHLNIQTSATSKLSTKTSNLSDFAVVGYAEDEYTTQKTKSSTIIYNPVYDYAHFNFKGMGSQADWGGSMKMDDLYNRYRNAMNSTYAKTNGQGYSFNYVFQEIHKSDGTIVQDTQNSDSAVYGNYYYPKRYYNNSTPENGEYYASLRSNSTTIGQAINNEYSSGRFNYISGLYKDVYTVTRNGAAKTGYKIHDGNNHYLSYDVDSDEFETVNSANNATIWLFENGGLYTYDEETYSTDIIRYLNGTTDLEAGLSTTKTTTWSWDDTYGTFKYTYNGKDYYLNCVNGAFKMANNLVITDGNGNYIRRNGNNIENTTNIDNATIWTFSTNGINPSGYLTDVTDNTKRLTINGASLITNNTGTSWQQDGTNIFNGNNVIKFNGTTWVVDTQNTYLIQYNGHYLTYTLSDTNIRANGTPWTLGNTLINLNGNGTISYNDGNNTYYLRYNAGLTTTNNANQATTWYHDQYGIYHNDNGTRYYIQYDTTWKAAICSQKVESGYYISYNGNNYLTADLSNTHKITNKTNTTEATLWKFSNTGTYPSGTISTVIDGVTWYVVASANGYVEMDTTPHTFTNNRNQIADTTTNYGLDGYRSNYWHSYSSNNLYTMTVTSASKSYDDPDNTQFAQIGVYTNYVSRTDFVSIGLTRSSDSAYDLACVKTTKISEFNYIPLNADKTTFAVDNNNTGYIVGGGYEGSGQRSDIRISQYYIRNINYNSNYININSGSGNSQTFKSFKDNVIQTINASGVVTINDNNNTFVKYKSSKEQLVNTLSNNGQNNNSSLYGLHFMDASININHLVVAPKVLINGKTYTNYEMPEDCIDFQVASKGYINFFAGTYYTDNDSFFSLHEIIRDTDENSPTFNKILAIKHISQIYSANQSYGDGYKAADNVYLYEDGTWSDTDVSSNNKYTLAFDKAWIEKQSSPSSIGYQYTGDVYYGRVFYFEIPVNKGEFALGSVSGGTGAYLFYLDIGANAAPVDRTIITQHTTLTQESLIYVNGIQILAAGSTFTSDANSCVAVIKTTNSGAVNISRTGDTVTFTASSALDSTYKDDGITLSGATWAPTATTTSTSKVLRYVDFNRATDKLYYTTIYNNGTSNTSYDCYRIDDIATGEKTQITDTTDQAEWGILTITNGSGVNTQFANYENIASKTYGSTKILDYYSYINTSSLASYSQTIEMTVAADATVVPDADGDYVYEHSYHLAGDAISMAPNGLLIYIGPDFKSSATITGPTNDLATVTTTISTITYVFTFNASQINNTNKTIIIYYQGQE